MTEFTSKFEGKIDELKAELKRLYEEQKAEKEKFIEEKKVEGWQHFVHRSDYYGSHSEYGEGSYSLILLFRPEVDLSQWDEANFAHGHSSFNEDSERWNEWFGALDENLYILVEEKDEDVLM